MADRPPLTSLLRAATREDHERVDAAFGRFDLATTAGYIAFLGAQARALPAIEELLRPGELIPGWTGRSAALSEDLAALGAAPPTPLALTLPEGAAARWGGIYVLEGSRLGGIVLAKRVPATMPSAFLRAAHPSGAWRALLARLDYATQSESQGEAAVAGAKAVFAAFAVAAHV